MSRSGHLRRLFHEPASTPEMDSVRGHLADCEDCRAIVAGLETGDGDGNGSQRTQTDESQFPTQPAFVRRNDSGLSQAQDRRWTRVREQRPADADRSRRGPVTASDIVCEPDGRVARHAERCTAGAHEATVCLSAGGTESSGSFLLADPSGFSGGTQTNDSSETGHFLLGGDPCESGRCRWLID